MEAEDKRGKRVSIFLIRYTVYKSEKNHQTNSLGYSSWELKKVK